MGSDKRFNRVHRSDGRKRKRTTFIASSRGGHLHLNIQSLLKKNGWAPTQKNIDMVVEAAQEYGKQAGIPVHIVQ
jgi:hypothetical protein